MLCQWWGRRKHLEKSTMILVGWPWMWDLQHGMQVPYSHASDPQNKMIITNFICVSYELNETVLGLWQGHLPSGQPSEHGGRRYSGSGVWKMYPTGSIWSNSHSGYAASPGRDISPWRIFSLFRNYSEVISHFFLFNHQLLSHMMGLKLLHLLIVEPYSHW
jgi:hypothetical protein